MGLNNRDLLLGLVVGMAVVTLFVVSMALVSDGTDIMGSHITESDIKVLLTYHGNNTIFSELKDVLWEAYQTEEGRKVFDKYDLKVFKTEDGIKIEGLTSVSLFRKLLLDLYHTSTGKQIFENHNIKVAKILII